MSRDPAPRTTLEGLFRAALAHTHAGRRLVGAIESGPGGLRLAGEPLPDEARLHVIATGKAATAMAAALEAAAGARIAAGLVVTRAGHGGPLERFRLVEAGHPLPDARSAAAGEACLALAADVPPRDVLVVLLSGGTSALLSRPQPGLGLADLVETTRLLLGSGADIEELNCVRKHLTEVSGGRLAGATRAARIEVFVISDVLGDRLEVVGSGPCVPDSSRFGDALGVIESRGLLERVPPRVRAHLEAGAHGQRPESPKPGSPGFERVRHHVLASNRDAREAVLAEARRRGLRAVEVTGCLRGEARVAGGRLATLLDAVSAPQPVCLVAGGETTVTLVGPGLGGRCQELALAAAIALAGRPRVALLAAGTDGSDGPTDAAGAFADGDSVARAAAGGWDARACLARNDAYRFFGAAGGLVHTGPTHTNVLDLALGLWAPAPASPE